MISGTEPIGPPGQSWSSDPCGQVEGREEFGEFRSRSELIITH